MVTMFSTILSICVLCYVTLSVLSEELQSSCDAVDLTDFPDCICEPNKPGVRPAFELEGLQEGDCPVLCSQSCLNGGACTGPNTCSCPSGYTGTRCQTPICSPSCLNGGTCTSPNTCSCPSEYTGTRCQTPICSQSCLNGGTCTSPNTCSCPSGYTGNRCQTPICSPSCLNGGTCTSPNTCSCQSGYTGTRCQTPICSPSCSNGGACTSPNTCSCPSGYTGTRCQTLPVCDVLNAPMNGHVTYTMTTVFTDGDMQMIECDDGFTSIGETSTVCTVTGNGGSGTWEPDIASTTCVPVCDVLNAPRNGHAKNTMTTVFTDGDMQMIECGDGFTPMGETSTVCTVTGNGGSATWEPDIASTTCVIGSTTSSADRPTEKIPATGSRVGIGFIVGIVIGVVSLVVIVTVVVVCYFRGSCRQTKSKGDNENVSPTVGHTYVTTIEDNGEINMEPVIYANEDQSNDQIGQMYEDVQGGALNAEDECAYANPDVTDKDQEYTYADSHRKDKEQEYAYADSDVRAKEEEYAYANSDVKDKEPEYAFADSDVKDKDPEYAYADFKPKLNPPEKISPIYANSPVSK